MDNPTAMRSLVGYTRSEVEAVAKEAESFWTTGVSAEESNLRRAAVYLGLESNAVGLTFASAIIFRECYMRGIKHG